MTKKEYSELLKHPLWQKKRLRILKRDNHKCTKCDKTKYLQVHHTYYENDKKPWEYPDVSLVTLCRGCHKKEHEKKDISEFVRKNKSTKKKNKTSKKKSSDNKKKQAYESSIRREEKRKEKKRLLEEKRNKDIEDIRNKRRRSSKTYKLPEYQHLVGKVGFEPTNSEENGFTDRLL